MNFLVTGGAGFITATFHSHSGPVLPPAPRPISLLHFTLSLLLLSSAGLLAQSAGKTPANLVYFQKGDVPVIITAPHGGTNAINNVITRPNGVLLRDDGTYELALLVNEELTKLLKGRKPYVVAARFHRKYIDANRAAEEAYESPAAKAIYEDYHQHIRDSVAETRRRFGGEGLLVDLHGQARDAASIFRGTANGLTVMRLIQMQGEAAFTGTNSLLGRLALAGYQIVPPNTPPGKPPEDRSYNGGFTVRTYGSHREDGLDAIQLELGSKLRRADRKRFAADLAGAIVAFQENHLKTQPEKAEHVKPRPVR